MSIAERLRMLARYEGNQSRVAEKIGLTTQSISKTIVTNAKIKSDTLESIANAYPELNMRWFLTGVGESGLDGEVPVVVPVEEKDPEKEELKEELLTMYKYKIEVLERELGMIKREVKEHVPDLAKKLEL